MAFREKKNYIDMTGGRAFAPAAQADIERALGPQDPVVARAMEFNTTIAKLSAPAPATTSPKQEVKNMLDRYLARAAELDKMVQEREELGRLIDGLQLIIGSE